MADKEIEKELKETGEDAEQLVTPEIDFDGLNEKDETDEDKIDSNEEKDDELLKLKSQAENIQNLLKNNPRIINRVENKHDFATEVANAKSNQKLSNLKEEVIYDLIEKRKFMNFCIAYKWDVLADLIKNTISDIENYSLSKEGFLIRHAMTDNVKSTSIQEVKQNKNERRSEYD